MGGWQEGVLSPRGPPVDLHCCPLVWSVLLGLSLLELRSELPLLPLGRGSWLVSPSGVPRSLGHGAGDRCLHMGSNAKMDELLARGLPAG